MSVLNTKEREAVAVAAAVGAGCRPCTQYHVRAAREGGLSDDEIRMVVEEAEVMRIHAATSIADFARSLLGPGEEPAVPLCIPTEPLQALAQVGAATGGNAGQALASFLPYARGLGLTNRALSEAVQIAGVVKRMAAEFFGRDAERALGESVRADAMGEAGPCIDTPSGAEGCAGARELVNAGSEASRRAAWGGVQQGPGL